METRVERRSHSCLFFSSRADGENKSTDAIAWRYGRGNVFIPPGGDPAEAANAVANTVALVAEYMPTKTQSVMLSSKYLGDVTVVDKDFLLAGGAEPIVHEGDGLFTQETGIALLNKSGDAHAIIFESPTAAGILVGSWRCIKGDVFAKMVAKFLERGIHPEEITISVGPGLGPDSYSFHATEYHQLVEVMPWLEPKLGEIFPKKMSIEGRPQKYVLNFPLLIRTMAFHSGITNVDIAASVTTFNKEAWKKVKTTSTPKELQDYYQGSSHFSARFYTRLTRQIYRRCEIEGSPLPVGVGVKEIDYSGTGRCLNGVMLLAKEPSSEAAVHSGPAMGVY